jgi:UDP-N-acetylmuramoylalanine--D-glutamate ligase
MKINSEATVKSSGATARALDFPYKSAAVIGAARSGIAAAKLLCQMGVDVLISDSCKTEKLEALLASGGISHFRHEAGGHSAAVLDADLIVLSPGVQSDLSILLQARDKGIPVWSEIELAFRLSSAPYAAVTGSTGKSTTVSFLGAIFAASKKEHVVAGNIGLPLCSAAPAISAQGVVVAEISSFQLETIDRFHPRAAAVLNFLKNHLDRYKNEQAYYDAKKEIVRNMGGEDLLVLNACDPLLVKWADEMRASVRVMFFGREAAGHDCVWNEKGGLFIRRSGKKERILNTDDMFLKGQHNIDNASAAAALASAFGVEINAMAAGISGYRGLPHRLEFVRELDGVKYYNDSKATTSESVSCAVGAFCRNVHLICGGRDKGCDFKGIKNTVKEQCRSVFVIGEATERIIQEWEGVENMHRAESLADALDKAKQASRVGDVVVLSPGCSSFDMFTSYEHRGEVFRNLVMAYDGERKKR